jgi:uncharacterized protein
MKRWSYAGRWALVTGASAGLGRAFARQLADRGMHLVLTARRRERLEELAGELEAGSGISVVVVPIDLARPGAADELWAESSRGRSIHLLVNNAGFGAQGRFQEIPLDRQVEMLRVNCEVPLELTHLALREMTGRGEGGILNVSSLAAFQPVPRLATYAASKAFLLSLSEALWAESGGTGVRVVALCPGRTPTEFQAVAGTGDAAGTFGARTPEQVVAAGLRALERNRSSVVPGAENLAASWAVRALPRSLVIGVMKRIVRRIWKPPPS